MTVTVSTEDAFSPNSVYYLNDARFSDGSRIVVWHDGFSSNIAGIYYQRYDAEGIRVGPVVQVVAPSNMYPPDRYPAVTTFSDGGFAISWIHTDYLVLQRFQADGTKVGPEIKAGGYPYGSLDLATNDLGQIGILYSGSIQIVQPDGAVGSRVFFTSSEYETQEITAVGHNFHIIRSNGTQLLYSETGALLGSASYVGERAKAALLANGDIVVVSSMTDGLYAQVFHADLSPVGGAVLLKGFAENRAFDLTALPDGGYAVINLTEIGIFNDAGVQQGPRHGVPGYNRYQSLEAGAPGVLSLVLGGGAGRSYVFDYHTTRPYAQGDLDGDGTSDIVTYSSTTGVITRYNMKEGSLISSGQIAAPGSAFSVQAAGDITYDNQVDLVLKNSVRGATFLWELDSGNNYLQRNLGVLGDNWSVRSVGDFNGDHSGDLLLRNSDNGQLYIYLMDVSMLQTGSVNLGALGTTWDVSKTGDVDGDGDADIVLRDSATGRVDIFEMQGGAFVTNHSFGALGTNWVVAGMGDINGDGRDDILLKDTTSGVFYGAMMNADHSYTGNNLGAIGTDWNIAANGDYNGDGIDDILWRHATTGQVYLWTMNSSGQPDWAQSHSITTLASSTIII